MYMYVSNIDRLGNSTERELKQAEAHTGRLYYWFSMRVAQILLGRVEAAITAHGPRSRFACIAREPFGHQVREFFEVRGRARERGDALVQ